MDVDNIEKAKLDMMSARMREHEARLAHSKFHMFQVSKYRYAVIGSTSSVGDGDHPYKVFHPLAGLEKVDHDTAHNALNELNSGRKRPEDYDR